MRQGIIVHDHRYVTGYKLKHALQRIGGRGSYTPMRAQVDAHASEPTESALGSRKHPVDIGRDDSEYSEHWMVRVVLGWGGGGL